MLNDNAKYFTEDFKQRTVAKLRMARQAYCKEVFRAPIEDVQAKPHDFATVGMHPGFRFFSDEQCWHSFVNEVTEDKWFALPCEMVKEKVLAVEFQLDREPDEWRLAVWRAVKAAAECDHHYEYEKDY